MKIRTRAFLVLWLITILVAGTVGFIIYALNVASARTPSGSASPKPHRARLAVARARRAQARSARSRRARPAIDPRAPAAPSERRQRLPRAPGRAGPTIPNSAAGCSSCGPLFDKWSATWTRRRRSIAGSPDVLLALSERRVRADQRAARGVRRRAARARGTNPSGSSPRAAQLFFSIMTAIFVSAMLAHGVADVLDQARRARSADRADRRRRAASSAATSAPHTRRCAATRSAC